MNKKYLSVVLFSALMLGTAGTFTSCKDYDDDINALNEKVSGMMTTLEELQAAAGKYVTAVNYDAATGKLTVTGGNGGTYTIPLPPALPSYELKVTGDQKNGYKVELWKDGKKISGGDIKYDIPEMPEIPEIPAAFDPQLLKWKDGYLYYGDQKIEGVQQPAMKEGVVMTPVKDEKTGDILAWTFTMNGQSATFSIVSELKSLVFEPVFYYEGIEAMTVNAIQYEALTLGEVGADKDNAADKPAEAAALTEVTPDLAATYHMNPSSADTREWKLENFKFLAADKNYTRAADGVVVPTVTKFDAKLGKLTVNARLTEGTIKSITDDEKVTVMALQVTASKDNVVTSDYAAVKKMVMKDFALNNPKATDKESHLYGTAQEAIANAAQVKVSWNETVDLAEYVQTHFIKDGGNNCTAWDKNAKAGVVEKSNFAYQYELAGYFMGGNETSQTAHAALDGSVLRPQLPNAEGKAAKWGETEQSQATVGRMPLVRVVLKDNNSNKNVAVGYLKVEIIGASAEDTYKETNYGFGTEFTLSCREADFNEQVAWYQIENQILAMLKLSKEDFERLYVADTYEENGVKHFNQYNKVGTDATVVSSRNTEVALTKDDTEGTMTEIIKWSIPANYAYEFFQKNETMSAIVRFVKDNKDLSGQHVSYEYVYVTLNWTPSPRNINPTGKLDNSDKTQQYWFAKNNTEGGSGYEEIHVNTEVPGGTNNVINFNKALLETFNDKNVTISGIDPIYKDFQDGKLTKTFRFVNPAGKTVTGVSGTTYILTAEKKNTVLFATKKGTSTKESVAMIDDSSNKIALANTAFAKDLLNVAGRADSEELAKNLTARVQITNVNECGKSLNKFENNEFDVKFLRPITVKAGEMDSFKDGVDVGAEGSKIDLKLDFTDWRNYAFATSPVNYYEYYKVESIAVDEANATTNVGGKWAKLPEGMKFTYEAATADDIKAGKFGTLTYLNNKAEVGAFKIKADISVKYYWGTIKLEGVEFNVAKTVQ